MSGPSHGKTIGEINQEHWESVATTFAEKPWMKDLMNSVTELVHSNISWLGLQHSEGRQQQLRMLDYACGAGTAALAFAPYVTTIKGIDFAPQMVAQFNKAAHNGGMSPDTMHAVVGDLLTSTADSMIDGAEFHEFDIAVISLALHHVEDPQLMIERLVQRLRSGGLLVVIDWGSERVKLMDAVAEKECTKANTTIWMGPKEQKERQAHDHGHSCGSAHHTVAHRHGFGKQDILGLFSKAGLEDGAFCVGNHTFIFPHDQDNPRRIFIAKARKSALK